MRTTGRHNSFVHKSTTATAFIANRINNNSTKYLWQKMHSIFFRNSFQKNGRHWKSTVSECSVSNLVDDISSFFSTKDWKAKPNKKHIRQPAAAAVLINIVSYNPNNDRVEWFTMRFLCLRSREKLNLKDHCQELINEIWQLFNWMPLIRFYDSLIVVDIV